MTGDRICLNSVPIIFVEIASSSGTEGSYLNGGPSTIVFDDTLGVSAAKAGIQLLMTL